MTAPRLITDNLDLWTAAVTPKANNGRGKNGQPELTGIKKLRELILELAVRGKLVPQNPADEPVSALLEKIAAEKARLVKEGKIKKPKPLPAVGEGEQPFVVPEGWEWVRLGEITQKIGSGATPRGGKEAYTTHGVPFFRSQNIWNDGLHLEDVAHINVEIHERMSNTHVIAQDVLLNITGASLGRCTIVPSDLLEANVSQHVTIIRPIDPMDRYFLHKTIISPYVQSLVWGRQVGMAREGLSKRVLELFEIPVPPLAEQHRIVEKIDELMALCDRLEQQTSDQLAAHETLVETLLDTLARSADATELAANWTRLQTHFDTLFTTESSIDRLKQTILELTARGRLVDYPSSKTVPLRQVLSFGPRNGLSPKPVDFNTGIKVLKLGATTTGKLLLEESKNAAINEPASSHLWLKAGDILIQRGNTAAYVGSNVLVTEDLDGIIYPDLMMKIRPNSAVDGQFLSIILSAPVSRKFMWDRMTGTSGTMPKISKKVVESIPILVPDFECQELVVRKVGKLMAICEQLKARLNHLRQTQQCLVEAVAVQTLA